MQDTSTLSTGQATSVTSIRALYKALQGNVITESDTGYDQARQVWNAAIDRRPVVITRPSNTQEVVAAVNFAREHNLLVAVRCGGHGLPGFGTADEGLVIDMSLMKGVQVDPENGTARVQGGVIGKELGAAAGPHGLALPLGTVPTTGVTGVLLGGGIGWLTRKYGLSIDHLLSAEVVTADGEVLTASEHENPDLFWALRGGGGNFGVVTQLEVRLRPAGMVVGGMLLHPSEQAGQVLRAYRDYVATAPDELSSMVMFMTVPPIPVVPQALHGRRVMAIGVCYTGDPAKGQAALVPLRAIGQPLLDMVSPMPFGVLQGMGEGGGERGIRHDVRADYLAALSDEAIDTIVSHATQAPGHYTQTHIIHLGGAMARIAPEATAFRHRHAPFLLAILPGWTAPGEGEAYRSWMLEFSKVARPFGTGGVYVNFLGDEGQDRVRAAYGANYERLAEIKKRYDPTNFFRLNQNITPSA